MQQVRRGSARRCLPAQQELAHRSIELVPHLPPGGNGGVEGADGLWRARSFAAAV